MSDLPRDIDAIPPWPADPAAYYNSASISNGFGRRVRTHSDQKNGNGSWFIYDGDQLVQERERAIMPTKLSTLPFRRWASLAVVCGIFLLAFALSAWMFFLGVPRKPATLLIDPASVRPVEISDSGLTCLAFVFSYGNLEKPKSVESADLQLPLEAASIGASFRLKLDTKIDGFYEVQQSVFSSDYYLNVNPMYRGSQPALQELRKSSATLEEAAMLLSALYYLSQSNGEIPDSIEDMHSSLGLVWVSSTVATVCRLDFRESITRKDHCLVALTFVEGSDPLWAIWGRSLPMRFYRSTQFPVEYRITGPAASLVSKNKI